MECLNCGESNLSNEAVARIKCSRCGLISVARVYSLPAKSPPVDTTLIDLVMLCNEFDEEDIEAVKKIYRSGYLNLYRGRYSLSDLAVCALYIHKRQTNQPHNLRAYCEYFGSQKRRINRMLERLSTIYNTVEHYTPEEASALIRNIELKINTKEADKLFREVGELVTINTGILCACIYRTSNNSFRRIAQVFHTTKQNVHNYNKRLEELI